MKILKLLKYIMIALYVVMAALNTTTITRAEETTEQTTEQTTKSVEETRSEDTEQVYNGYFVVLLAAIAGCLVALAFWIVFGG